MTYRLLVNSPSGEQRLEYITISGGYFDVSRVVWDERIDGALPDSIELGKMIKSNGALIKQDNFLPDHQAWLNANQLKESENARINAILDEAKNDVAIQAIKGMSSAQIDAYFSANISTLPNVIAIIKKMMKILVKNL